MRWMAEYNVSLRKPNKRFQMKESDNKERVYEYIKMRGQLGSFLLSTF